VIRLPPNHSPIRALLDVPELVALTTSSACSLPTIREAFESPPVVRIYYAPPPGKQRLRCALVRGLKGDVMLIGFSEKARASYALLWNFGQPEVTAET
jgi:hypothetical protein